jgi:D-inositol-3-phosphate glycosyltransferase
VPVRDPRALAAALLGLLGDPHAREARGRAARDRAVERFDGKAVADRVVAAYRSVLERKGLADRLAEQEELDG